MFKVNRKDVSKKTIIQLVLLTAFVLIWLKLFAIKLGFGEISSDFRLHRTLLCEPNQDGTKGPNPYSTDHWKYIGNSSLRFQVFSAYFDDRIEVIENFRAGPQKVLIGTIRVITILHINIKKKKISCNFRFEDRTWKKVPAHHVVFVNDYLWTTYVATFVICPVTETKSNLENVNFPVEVGVTYDMEPSMMDVTSTVQIKYPINKRNLKEPVVEKNEMVVCSCPAYNFQNSRRIVEHVELWKKMGATQFYFYNKTVSANVDKVIRYYQEQGDMQVFNWTLNDYKFEEDLRIEGQLASNGDCLYRAMVVDNVKYIANADYDEFLIPRDGSDTLFEFMERRDNKSIHSFNFRMALMIQGRPEHFSPVPKNIKNSFLYSKVHVGRLANESLYPPHHIRSKYIMKTRKAVEMGIHFLFKSVKNTLEYNVNTSEGLLYHYRDDCGYDYCTPENTVTDNTVRIYGRNLWNIVDSVCGKIFENGICPN